MTGSRRPVWEAAISLLHDTVYHFVTEVLETRSGCCGFPFKLRLHWLDVIFQALVREATSVLRLQSLPLAYREWRAQPDQLSY